MCHTTTAALENLDNICELSWTSYTTLLVFARGLLPELHKLERSAELEQLEAVVQATVSHTYQSDASSAGTGRFPFGSTSPGTSSWHAGTHQAISQAPANCANFFNQSDTAMPTAATLHFPPLYASQTNQSDMMGPLPPSSLPGGGQTQASLSWTEHPNEVSAVWAWQQVRKRVRGGDASAFETSGARGVASDIWPEVDACLAPGLVSRCPGRLTLSCVLDRGNGTFSLAA